MAIPTRHSPPEAIHYDRRTFFLTTPTWGKRRLLQTDRMAQLLIDTIFHYREEHKFEVHEFVVMPDHLHVLLTIGAEMTIEQAAQFIKGGSAYRASRQFGLKREIWQRGFSEVRILTADEYAVRVKYTRENPVRAGLASAPEGYAYSPASGGYKLDPPPWPAAEAADSEGTLCGTTKVVP